MASSPDQPIPAALTPEQARTREIARGTPPHALIAVVGEQVYYDNSWGEYGCDPLPARTVAALCLYQQPFGFTRADVAMLHLLADAHDVVALPGDDLIAPPPWWPEGVPSTCNGRASLLRSIAARIAALLPPPPTSP